MSKTRLELLSEWKTQKKNLGFNPEGTIMKKSVSSVLYNNPNVAGFLDSIEAIVYQMITLPKRIRTHNNYTVKKNDNTVN